MNEQFAIELFCSTVRAYFPGANFLHIDVSKNIFEETTENIRVSFWCKNPHDIISNTQFGILIKAGLSHSLVTPWPSKYPDSFEIVLNPHFGKVAVIPSVVGYPDWPRIYLRVDDGTLDRFTRLIYSSDVYSTQM